MVTWGTENIPWKLYQPYLQILCSEELNIPAWFLCVKCSSWWGNNYLDKGGRENLLGDNGECGYTWVENEAGEYIFNLRRKLPYLQHPYALCSLSLSHLKLPVLTPPVKIHAPVVMAALMRPFPKTCLSFGWSSKFCRPPWTEMRSLGSSNCHSLVIRCKRRSGFVSKDTLTYCKKNNID